MNLAECRACFRMWNDKDKTRVCPTCGTENHCDDDELDHQPPEKVQS